MNFVKATASYEAWLGKCLRLVAADLQHKHEVMTDQAFVFFRGTFYRWAQFWSDVGGPALDAPKVLAVGDLHVENFGTWRDHEGRLIWGVNDFDEAYSLPYTQDLVRLAASAYLAIDAKRLSVDANEVCEAILSGYGEALAAGGRPVVLAEEHVWLRKLALNELRDPVPFWAKIDGLRATTKPLPVEARRGLERMMPEPGLRYRVTTRRAGVGSLGRERYVAAADCNGGKVAREAKALAPSACVWASSAKGSKILYEEILKRAVRQRDPFVQPYNGWIVRRLAPDCSRVELTSLPRLRDERRLLHAMGWETANIHLGTRDAKRLLQADLRRRGTSWLRSTADELLDLTLRDWKEWRKG